jgi:N-acyl-D-aspartate/D-glutamate deacylase
LEPKGKIMNRRQFVTQCGYAWAANLTAPLIGTGARAEKADSGYDVVVLNGRVMDPESNLDSIRNIGVQNNTIRAISKRPLHGRVVIDAKGLVVAPGFIDVLAHGMDIENNRYQVHDGVTTILALEGETADIDAWYAAREGKLLLNYGASVGHGAVRRKVMGTTKTEDAEYKGATDAQVEQMKTLVDEQLKRGALAVGFGLEYTPGTSHWEVLEMFRVAQKFGAPCHVHTRFGALIEPDNNIAAVEEVIAASAVTGAPLHIVHVPSMALSTTPVVLQMIAEAQARGMDLTACCYPYTAFGTGISSAVFDDGWKARFGIDYGDLQWAATGERLTAETFAKYHKAGGMVIAHAIPEAAVLAAVTSPTTMVSSDGGLSQGKGHPRSSGTFARVLGHYVRDQRALPLMVAIRKMTLMPARRLEKRAPMMTRKGRIRLGADADLTIFDADRVIDKATFDQPSLHSEGIRYVLVNGAVVLNNGKLIESALPGKPVRAPFATHTALHA